MRSSASSTIACEQLSKWYGKVVGINDFSVEIGSGVTGLLGPNGAGKSTLIKLIVGALKPSKGAITVLGEKVWNNRTLLARIGYCPDHDGIYDDLSGLEFVSAMAQLSGYGTVEARRRASEVLDRVGLDAARERPIGQYSKGMRQRVKLAQAIVHDPDVVLFDEPLTGCDPVARVEITRMLKELGGAGKTVLVSSHILHEIESMTDEIVLIYKGQVLADGNIYRIREMIDAHPHKIRVTCSEPRALARELVANDAVIAVGFGDTESLLIETRRPDDCYSLIPRVALEHGVKIRELTSPDNNLQAVFAYLTQDQRAQGVSRG